LKFRLFDDQVLRRPVFAFSRATFIFNCFTKFLRSKRPLMISRKIFSIACALTTSAFIPNIAAAQATKTDSVIFYNNTAVDSIIAVTQKAEKLASVLARSKDNEAYLAVVRTKSGDVEVHEQWDDVTIVRSGRGVLRTGYDVKSSKMTASTPTKEWVGGEIQNGKDRQLLPGDFIVIPAMLGHQFLVQPGDTLTCWTIKVKRPVKPAR
jgi:hypothetical protein